MVKKIIKTNPNLIELINKLNKQSKSEDAAIWKDVANRLSRSNRRTAEVNLSDINISKVTNMDYMFNGCINLEYINLKFCRK